MHTLGNNKKNYLVPYRMLIYIRLIMFSNTLNNNNNKSKKFECTILGNDKRKVRRIWTSIHILLKEAAQSKLHRRKFLDSFNIPA